MSESDQMLRPVEGQRVIPIPGGHITLASPFYKLKDHRGVVHLMEFHTRFGPIFLRKDGEPLAKQPGERNPVWKAFNLWHTQGKLVDQDNNCVWRDADPKAVDLTKPRMAATEILLERVKALMACRVLPASWDKAFIRGMAAMTAAPAPKFTEAQARNIARLCRKYRGQIKNPDLIPHDGEWL